MRILIAEDEPVISADLEACLRRYGYEIVATPDTGEDAVSQSIALKPDLVLMDIILGGGIDGIEAATRLNKVEIPVVFVTSHADHRTLIRARETAPFGYVLKPFEPRALQAAVEIALHRARAEAGQRKVERWLATTLRSIADAVIATDRSGRITFLNPAAEMLTGWPQTDALGRLFEDVFDASYETSGDPLRNLVSQVLSEDETVHFGESFRLRSRNGLSALIEQAVAPVRDDDGEVTGAVVVFRDCTLRKQAEKEVRRVQSELQNSNETLRRKNQELQGFYHTVSHELKTPLTAAREFVSLVLEGLAGPVTETQVEYLQAAQESCDQMRISINDLLDSTRIDTGKMHLETKPGSLGTLVERVVAMLAPAAANKQVNLESAIEPDLPAIPLDEHRIAQVLSNLINNAIKFTPSGGRIRVVVTRSATAPEYLEVHVRDTGCGIASEHLERVFERLYQVRGEDVSQGKGLGLGLHICQELVQLHGGKIWAHSKPGAGSVFSFVLPLEGAKRLRVLVVDDEAPFREMIQEILERAGYEVILAESGREALDRMTQRPAELAILDLAMPDMDGPATLERLRSIQPDVPVIVHTGYTDGDLLTRALKHSCLTLLPKPCDAKRFVATVGQVIAARKSAA